MQQPFRLQRYAIAASVIVAFLVGIISIGNREDTDDLLVINNNVARLLDTMPSGTSTASFKLLHSFIQGDGSLCRTYTNVTADGNFNGLSCRDISGNWEVVELLPGVPTTAYIPASGETDSAINELTKNMKTLSANEEKKYLKE